MPLQTRLPATNSAKRGWKASWLPVAFGCKERFNRRSRPASPRHWAIPDGNWRLIPKWPTASACCFFIHRCFRLEAPGARRSCLLSTQDGTNLVSAHGLRSHALLNRPSHGDIFHCCAQQIRFLAEDFGQGRPNPLLERNLCVHGRGHEKALAWLSWPTQASPSGSCVLSDGQSLSFGDGDAAGEPGRWNEIGNT